MTNKVNVCFRQFFTDFIFIIVSELDCSLSTRFVPTDGIGSIKYLTRIQKIICRGKED